jgi:glycosyltransferase involved in cell wall biosynthesis
VTLHDATFFTDADLHSRVKVRFFRAATRLALSRAACCMVASQASADELVAVAHADPARLHVAHLGVDSAVFSPPSRSAVEAVQRHLRLPPGQDWVAFLGTLEPRKNIGALIRGWIAAVRGRVNPPALVLAGGTGWDRTLDGAIEAVPAGLTVLRPGYLPSKMLAGLLGGATVVAYPSLGEGFGLPVLEAMACGAAVLTTRRMALPEVGGDAVAYTDTDEASIARSLQSLLDDAPRRARLGSSGVARAAGFTWDACASAHVRAYERALAA